MSSWQPFSTYSVRGAGAPRQRTRGHQLSGRVRLRVFVFVCCPHHIGTSEATAEVRERVLRNVGSPGADPVSMGAVTHRG